MIRMILSLLVAIALAIPSQSHARSERFDRIASTYNVKFRQVRIPKAGSAQVAKNAAQAVAHQGQAMILILLLTGVEIMRQDVELKRVQQQSIDPKEWAAHSVAAAETIINSSEIWSSLLGGSASSATLSKPIAVLNGLIQNSSARPILKDLLSNGIGTLGVFLGWELGGQLFEEAREMIVDDAEYERAGNVLSLLAGALRSYTSKGDSLRQKDRDVLSKIAGNVVKILVTDDELRNLWLYNAFRHRIATGHFATLIGSMVGAATAGSALFPGAGTLGGMMFGLAGGTLSLFIPHEKKDWITRQFQGAREAFWMSGREGYGLFKFIDVYDTVLRISSERIRAGEPLPPMLKFNYNSKAINEIMTVHFEQITKLESNYQSAQAMWLEANKSGNAQAEEEYAAILAKTKQDFATAIGKAKEVYDTDLTQLESLFQRYDFFDLMNDPTMFSRHPVVGEFKALHERMQKLRSFLNGSFLPTVQAELTTPIERKSSSRLLQKFYIFGYDENEILSKLVMVN